MINVKEESRVPWCVCRMCLTRGQGVEYTLAPLRRLRNRLDSLPGLMQTCSGVSCRRVTSSSLFNNAFLPHTKRHAVPGPYFSIFKDSLKAQKLVSSPVKYAASVDDLSLTSTRSRVCEPFKRDSQQRPGTNHVAYTTAFAAY